MPSTSMPSRDAASSAAPPTAPRPTMASSQDVIWQRSFCQNNRIRRKQAIDPPISGRLRRPKPPHLLGFLGFCEKSSALCCTSHRGFGGGSRTLSHRTDGRPETKTTEESRPDENRPLPRDHGLDLRLLRLLRPRRTDLAPQPLRLHLELIPPLSPNPLFKEPPMKIGHTIAYCFMGLV